MRFTGSITALPTPFISGRAERVDLDALRRLIEFQLANRTSGMVVSGSTGEGVSLSLAVRMAVTELAAGVVARQVPLIAGIGGASTREAVDMATTMAMSGATALLVTAPHYLRPTQRGLLTHFEAIAGAVNLPVILYNVPGRTAVDLLPETVAQLAGLPNVVAIKEASGSLERVRQLVSLGTIDVLGGEDHMIADCMQSGATGVIGVLSNLVPARVLELVQTAAHGGDSRRAASLVEHLAPLARALFLEPNPAPLKTCLARLGWCSGELRSPLLTVEPETASVLTRTLEALGLNA